MIFSSIEFLIFFVLFILIIKFFSNYQKSIIIVFSLFFYSYWNPIFILLILFLLISSYSFIKKDISLKISIPIVLLPLFYFKYSNFLINILDLKILSDFSYKSDLPLAISFITFTIIAILVDVKTKKYNENINFSSFSEFLIYFPQLIAGPILRANELIPALKKKIIFTNDNIRFGILLFTVGFVKKIFFADNIGSYIDPLFINPDLVDNKDFFKAYLLFPLQIYFDFSGYVDMALGISKILSIDLPINFNKPYHSRSITEFWRNWHITLSKWFRDYLYIPLGGSREGTKKMYFNLIITMSIAGLWHGASLNFILWGFLNGLILFIEKQIKFFFNLNDFIKIILTCFVVFNLWVVFRIHDFELMYLFFTNLLSNINTIFYFENISLLALVIFAIYTQKFDNYKSIESISKKTKLVFLLPITLIVLLTGFAISTGTSEKFIYFDF
jgi:alginate O-acetyltransferase complex protein AlgI